MRTHLLALATSAALIVAFGSFEASAQHSSYGSGWRDQQGDGYGRGRRDERGDDYGRVRRERGERYERNRRDDQGEGYGRRGRDDRDGDMLPRGMMRRGMMGPAQMGAGMMGPAMMRMMLVLMDTDGDGTVSLSEFQAAHERMFKALDANKEGKLTLQEVEAFFQGQNGMIAPNTSPSQRESSAPQTRPAQPDANRAQ